MKGVYKLINKLNGKFYLGSSKNLSIRKVRHFSDLIKNRHHSILLQNDFNNQKLEDFEFVIIEECENYKELEQKLLDSLDWNNSYNISKNSKAGFTIFNHPDKEKIFKNRTFNLSKHRHKIKPRFGKDNGNWKGGISVKECEICGMKIRSSNKSKCKKCFFENRDYNNIKNPFYGKTHSDETRLKISEKQKLRGYVGSQEKSVIINDVEYKSVSEAARNLKVTPSTIINRIRNPKFVDYFYKMNA